VVQLDPEDEDNYLDMAEALRRAGPGFQGRGTRRQGRLLCPEEEECPSSLRPGLLKGRTGGRAEEYLGRSFQSAPDDEDLLRGCRAGLPGKGE